MEVLFNSLFIALMTAVGALVGLFGYWARGWWIDVGLAYTGGVMLVASFTSLLIPASELGSFAEVALGFAAGAGAVFLMDRLLPHEHLVMGYEGPPQLRGRLKTAWLIALAIIIHNIPEGMAVGAATAYDPALGLLTALAIGVQDLPEGAAVTLPLAAVYRRRAAPLAIGILSGLLEGAVAAATALALEGTRWALPAAMSLAAGAMIYVTTAELFPEIYRGDDKLKPTLGFLLGFYTMLYLDTLK
ncbi:ZIP family metal transporter [Pyrobaculum neutrophilum]|uniref:Zinc/iron permease n=1 Tax=Pyrobaculum neutrophilum (strain DSM 2338 / JCM 9278 / NBRC 100436 / V24Sta) TaxID=444157 RepID=B1YBC5_PYRNV|nr:ZIP family metal transporter [Pyrobaculum neutrophilum]ACB39256.1 zinc/iron permease [Pyrobaculum neutrophilum V24Sta]